MLATKGRPEPVAPAAAFSKPNFQGKGWNFRLSAQNRVLEGLGSPQTHHSLGFDLDRFAGLRVPAHARLAVGFHRTSQIGNHEFARAALALLYRQLEELLKKIVHGLPGRLALLRQMAHNLGLAHRLCHLVPLPSSSWSCSSLRGGPNQGRARATL